MSDNLAAHRSVVAQAIIAASATGLCSLDNQSDVAKILRLQGKHSEALIVTLFPASEYIALVRRARLSLDAQRERAGQ